MVGFGRSCLGLASVASVDPGRGLAAVDPDKGWLRSVLTRVCVSMRQSGFVAIGSLICVGSTLLQVDA
jgi:hypothetical protein